MNKYILLLSFLIATIQLKAQSKKEQIQILSLRIDSLSGVLLNERNTYDNQIKEYSQIKFILKGEIQTLKQSIKSLETDKQTIELKLSERIQIIEDSLRDLKLSIVKLQSFNQKLNNVVSKSENISYMHFYDQNSNVIFHAITIYDHLERIWMSENLNVGKFQNGDLIPQAKTEQEWIIAGQNKRPAWCYYNNEPQNGTKYGRLYNWYAVNDPRGLAPKGWHIPKTDEWPRYEDTTFTNAENLKSIIGWYNNNGGTNKSGFSALPGGHRLLDPSSSNNPAPFIDIGKIGAWWSSSDYKSWPHYDFELTNLELKEINKNPDNWACDFKLLDISNDEFKRYISKSSGLSVRCVKDKK
jgi:uncharacterized protein (TIGR02145 family)